jgi:acetolactate decarboxylase
LVLKIRLTSFCIVILVLAVLAGGLSACSANPERGVLTQYSTIDSLMNGLFDGVTTFNEVQKHGDMGVGTFEKLDGEMIELDGKIYQVKSDGKVYSVKGTDQCPFAVVTFFKADSQIAIPFGLDMAGMQAFLDSKLPTINIFYAFEITGKFSYMKTRSVPAQSKPYPGLLEATKKQKTFEFQDVDGTIVGFRCPSYVNGVNLPGYHLHFITAKKDGGGHILDFNVSQAEVKYDYISQYQLMLPGTGSDFYKFDFTKDQSADLQKAESK